MAPIRCYNCGEFNHISRRCPEPPRLTRCPRCNKANKHASWCGNTNFLSEEINPDHVVFPAQPIVKFRLFATSEIGIRATAETKSLDLPMTFVPKNISIYPRDGKIEMYAFPFNGGAGDTLTYHKMLNLMFYDQSNVFYGHVFIRDDLVQVNNTIRIRATGEIVEGVFFDFEPDRPVEIVFKKSPIVRGVGLSIEKFGKTFNVMLEAGQNAVVCE